MRGRHEHSISLDGVGGTKTRRFASNVHTSEKVFYEETIIFISSLETNI